jgi:spermidine synthase
VRRIHWIGALYCVSGCAGLIYETVWIRAFALSFGNTLLSFSTVLSIFLAGLAIGASFVARRRFRRPLLWYGAAEIWISLWALVIPRAMALSPQILSGLYGNGGEGAAAVALARAALCALILLPATIPMGAGLPWLFEEFTRAGPGAPRLVWIYAVNTAGGALGAILAGLALLPGLGYQGTLLTASSLDFAVGLAAVWLALKSLPSPSPVRAAATSALTPATRGIVLVAFFSGWTAMVYEVAGSRVASLLFGPTAATVTITLAVVLLGLAAGSVLASSISRGQIRWLSGSQFVTAVLLLGASAAIATSTSWLADQIRAQNGSARQIELLEAALIAIILFPVMTAAGMALPLAMSQRGAGAPAAKLYGINSVGCILGALMTGWLLVPWLGSERTLYLGAAINAVIAVALIPSSKWRAAASLVCALALAAIVFPQWDFPAMTSGAYKYAPYFTGSTDDALHRGEVAYLREGRAGTVTVRRLGSSLVLAIDGKVDATDSGGDLLTEKLLAHLPLSQVSQPRDVCVIGLASGVTAGAALTYPVEHLDVLEVSNEVVEASHLFDYVNGKPLDSTRTHLIVNDGRNHLTLTSRRYDAILSEPSNPWIAGMNSMFTREFFEIARNHLKPGGVLAQWFHLYNMPPDDLRSLLRSFTEVFPSATLWQLNEGDVLLTGSAGDTHFRPPPAAALADLARVGVADPSLLLTLYLMRGQDLARFAHDAAPNTDNLPVLEFHGLRDLDQQTDEQNLAELSSFPKQVPAPSEVADVRDHPTPARVIARARMFEQAESYRLAFDAWKNALDSRPGDPEVVAGMLRSARGPAEIAAAGTLEGRTNEALSAAQKGNFPAAESLLKAVKLAWPEKPQTSLNLGVFYLEGSRVDEAIAAFHDALHADSRYVPAYEALAQASVQKHDLASAAQWSRRILEIDPTHESAKRALAELERRGVTLPAGH